MSDTPRTDAQGYGDGRHPYVPTEFARQLERELAAKDAHADEIYKAGVDLANMLSDRLDAERALADRLANAVTDLRQLLKAHGQGCGTGREALAAWKEARK